MTNHYMTSASMIRKAVADAVAEKDAEIVEWRNKVKGLEAQLIRMREQKWN